MRQRSKATGLAIAAGILATLSATGALADWPDDKPITIVHPYAAGSDAVMRLTAAGLEKRLGQTIIFENRPGAGGAIGTAYLARQAPDGYTLGTAYPGPTANYINTRGNLPYDPHEDFSYISRVSYSDIVLAVRKDFPADTLEELIAYMKAHPGEVSAGNNGPGSYGHMVELAFRDMAGVDFKVVPYNGSNAIVTDMLSGSLDMTVDFVGDAYMKQLQAESIKPIAIASERRSALLPDTPTFREAGVEITATPWGGIMAPKGVPKEIVEKINLALKDVLADPELIKRLAAIGQTAAYTSPDEFRQIVVGEEEVWRPIIKKYDIK